MTEHRATASCSFFTPAMRLCRSASSSSWPAPFSFCKRYPSARVSMLGRWGNRHDGVGCRTLDAGHLRGGPTRRFAPYSRFFCIRSSGGFAAGGRKRCLDRSVFILRGRVWSAVATAAQGRALRNKEFDAGKLADYIHHHELTMLRATSALPSLKVLHIRAQSVQYIR